MVAVRHAKLKAYVIAKNVLRQRCPSRSYACKSIWKFESIMAEMLYFCPVNVKRSSENMGNVFALQTSSQYIIGVITYMQRKYPTAMFAVANHGVASGLPRYEDMLDQSSPIAPIPRPWSPEPSCWTRTEEENIQQSQETEVSFGKRNPGKTQ